MREAWFHLCDKGEKPHRFQPNVAKPAKPLIDLEIPNEKSARVYRFSWGNNIACCQRAIALIGSAIGISPQLPDVWLAIRIPLEERNDGRHATSSSSSDSSGSSSISANPGSSSESAGVIVVIAAGVGISKRLADFGGAGFAGSAGLAVGAFLGASRLSRGDLGRGLGL